MTLDLSPKSLWMKYSGSYFETMMESSEKCAEFVFHENSKVRETAIDMLDRHWNLRQDSRYCDLLLERIENDPDDSVLALALHIIGKIYAYKDHQRYVHHAWVQEIAFIVTQEERSVKTRLRAYLALISICGHSYPIDLDFRSLASVDWEFVQNCLRGIERPKIKVFPTRAVSEREIQWLEAICPEAVLRIRSGNMTELTEVLTRKMQTSEHWVLHSVRALALLSVGRPLDAIQDATSAIAKNPDANEAYFTRAQCYRCIREIDKALTDMTLFKRLIETKTQGGS